MNILIAPTTAVACNESFEIIDNAAVHIEDGVITYIGPADAAPDFTPDETLGGEHIVALPGLVNTHTHTAMTLLRGYADDMALEPWLQTKIWPFEAHLKAADVYTGTQLAILEMLRGGTTTCADLYHFYETGTRAFIESGIRACPGGVFLGFLPNAPGRIANAIAFAAEYKGAGDGRISPYLAPHSLYTVDREQWKALIAGARKIDVPMHTHVAETKREVADVTAAWGLPPVQALKDVGALEAPLVGAHCVHLTELDLDIMQESHGEYGQTFRVAHNPTSNLKLASGFAPIPEMLKRGITVGVGTDGTASNNDLDMWEEMRLAAFIHKATTGDPTAVSAQEALLMATLEGARTLGLERTIGSLEVGKKADIVLVDFDQPHLTPRHSVVSHLVYAVKSSDVTATIVDGKILYRNGEFTTLDSDRIRTESAHIASRLSVAAHS